MISSGLPKGSGEAKDFAAMIARLEARYEREVGDDAAGLAELGAAAAVFDGDAFDALPEEEAEPRLAQCFALAAE